MDEIQDDDVFLNGTLSSPECGIVLGLNGTTTHVEEHYAKAVNYTLMVTAVSFLQVCLTAQSAVTGHGICTIQENSILRLFGRGNTGSYVLPEGAC